ncbi:MAG: hypothetical protein ACJ8C4_16530 [Gemmataceae bacterium]
MIEIHGTTTGLCSFCVGKAKKEKEVLIVKGVINGHLCKDHLLAVAQQQKPRDAQ